MKCFVLFLIIGSCVGLSYAKVLKEEDRTKINGLERDKRQMKNAEADVKMIAVQQGNGAAAAAMINADIAAAANALATPNNSAGIGTMAAMQMPANQLALNAAANMQLARYPQYASMGLPGFLAQNSFGLQNYPPRPTPNIVNPYPNFDSGYPGLNPAYMYGNGNLYPSGQQMITNGFGGIPPVPQAPLPQQQQPFGTGSLNNFANLNNLVNLANLQGLGAPAAAASLQSSAPFTGYPIMPPPPAPGYMGSYAPAY